MGFDASTLQSSIAPFLLLVHEVGIAPTSRRLQRGANLPQLLGVLAHGVHWSSRQVTLLRLPVISRGAGGRVQTPIELQDGKVNREALVGTPLDGLRLVQSMNATLRIVSVSVSVFSTTRCQSGSVIVAWSE